MKKALCPIAAFLTGIVISVMVVANTRLGELTTNEVSMIVNQTIGVILTTLILLAGRRVESVNPPRRPSRWYMYFGGLFGVLIMIANFYSVLKVGAALAMAAAVFGQSLMGLLLDIFGLFGMKRRRVDRVKGISIAVSFLGIVIMSLSKDGTLSLPYIAMGIGAGVLTMLQMTYNSSFAAAKGAIFSARQNALSGVLATALYAFILMPQATLEGFRTGHLLFPADVCRPGALKPHPGRLRLVPPHRSPRHTRGHGPELHLGLESISSSCLMKRSQALPSTLYFFHTMWASLTSAGASGLKQRSSSASGSIRPLKQSV